MNIITYNNLNKWGLGIGDWGLPNPQSPIPNPQLLFCNIVCNNYYIVINYNLNIILLFKYIIIIKNE